MFPRRHFILLAISFLGLAADVQGDNSISLNIEHGSRNLQDSCEDTVLRSANGQFNAESTFGKTQSTGLGTCNGLSSEVGPGVWYSVAGTGNAIKASTCNENTEFKATLLVYSGTTFDCTANQLTCVTASDSTDFECTSNTAKSTAVEWQSLNGVTYYVLVQAQIPGDQGTIWMNFRSISPPVNDDCKRAIGAIPPVDLQVDGTTLDANLSQMPDYCGVNQLYPGVWYSFFGTGSDMTIGACGNSDAQYAFSLYKGPNCDNLECELNDGTYSVTNISGDQSKCLYRNSDGSLALRELHQISFTSTFEQRYFLYIAHDPSSGGSTLTGDFRLFVKSLDDPPTFPPVEVPTRAPSLAPSGRPSPIGVTAFPTREPTAVPQPTTPTILPLPTNVPITSSPAPDTRSMLVCLLLSVGALVVNDMW
ncbi:unnamed protein product [Cylindrotheca closterium]|uniref:Uncharacterized protein n=1 Tax=Cylindrotheca closterium TaxID=2856 RepID=A0AAD2GD04_9STRA|nr:unnamed protein product [Cylindrotheca closterium]